MKEKILAQQSKVELKVIFIQDVRKGKLEH